MSRLFIEPEQFAGDEVRLTGARARRLRVLRLRAGDELRVFDGSGRERAARVERAGRATAVLRLGESVTALPEPPVAVTLACAFPRGARGDYVVEKTTELGVARIVALRSERAVLAAGEGRAARWRRVAIEAAEQCGRAVVPDIVVAAAGDELRGRATALYADGGASTTIAAALERVPALEAITLYVGPEGGWSERERAAHDRAGRVAVSLGPRTLRVETAAVVGVAQVMAATGGLDASSVAGLTG